MTQFQTIARHCPLCGTDNGAGPHIAYAPAEWPMKACRACGTVYLERTWALDVLYEAFDWDTSAAVEDARRREARGLERRLSKALRRVRRRLPRRDVAALIGRHAAPGNVLELGAGNGHHLSRLDDRFVPYGIEISSAAVARGQAAIEARGGRLVNQDALGGLRGFAPEFFSGMIMRSFLEHDSDPRQTLAEAHRVLQPNAIVVIKVPNYGCLNRRVMGANWCGFRFPEHVNYFTPESITRMLAETGFGIRRFSLLQRLPTSDNMWVIAERRAA